MHSSACEGAGTLPRVSVIVPAHNAEDTVGACVDNLTAQDYPSREVIVVDDGSTDGTAKELRGRRVRLIRISHGGPARARNRGAAAADGDVLIFVDADCRVCPGWMRNMIDPFRQDAVGAVQGRYAPAAPTTRVSQAIYEQIEYVFRGGGPLDFAWSFSLAVPRRVWREVGGFNESYREASAEDVDLAYRIVGAGHRIVLAEGAVVLHAFPPRLRSHLRRQVLQARNRVRLIARSGRLRDRQATTTAWLRLVSTGVLILCLPLGVWYPSALLVVAAAALALDAPIVFWSIRNHGLGAYLLPFRMVTRLSWLAGGVAGIASLIAARRAGRDDGWTTTSGRRRDGTR